MDYTVDCEYLLLFLIHLYVLVSVHRRRCLASVSLILDKLTFSAFDHVDQNIPYI